MKCRTVHKIALFAATQPRRKSVYAEQGKNAEPAVPRRLATVPSAFLRLYFDMFIFQVSPTRPSRPSLMLAVAAFKNLFPQW